MDVEEERKTEESLKEDEQEGRPEPRVADTYEEICARGSGAGAKSGPSPRVEISVAKKHQRAHTPCALKSSLMKEKGI